MEVADFHFKPIEIYREERRSERRVVIIITKRRGLFLCCGCAGWTADGWSTFTALPHDGRLFAPPLSFSQVGFEISVLGLVISAFFKLIPSIYARHIGGTHTLINDHQTYHQLL